MVLTDAQWLVLEPLIEACCPHRKTQHHHLRRTMEAIIWRCQNDAKWRAVPAEYGPCGWQRNPSDAVRQTRWVGMVSGNAC